MRQPRFVHYKQQANPLLSMNHYTPLVISGDDKNNHLTERNTLFALIKSLDYLKNLKMSPSSIWA